MISLLEEKIPKYKLRFDTITEFTGVLCLALALFCIISPSDLSTHTGYKHNDWLIETPLIDLNAPIDLSPEVLRETLSYFILSGERLSQMTRVYNDTDALTKLLEEVSLAGVFVRTYIHNYFVTERKRSRASSTNRPDVARPESKPK